MRVLVVHNRYSSRVPSGENLAVRDEVGWLRDAGLDVRTYEVTNDDAVGAGRLQQVQQAVDSQWSRRERNRVLQVVNQVVPDLVHVHNLFPLLSASVPGAVLKRDIPLVWTAHNYRLVCVGGTHYRDNHPCHSCQAGWRLPGVRHGCYSDSSAASALVTGATASFRRMLRRKNVTTVAISDHVRRWLITAAGVPGERVLVKHNGVSHPPVTQDTPVASKYRTILFLGRLNDAKGVSLLLEAWRRVGATDAELRFVGAGPLSAKIEEEAERDSRIRWVGQTDAAGVSRHLSESRAVVVPSIWEETFGRTAAEAFAYGRPVITTGMGGLSDVVDPSCGWITGSDAAALGGAITESLASDDRVTQKAAAGAAKFHTSFTPEVTTKRLIDIYERSIRSSP